MLIWVGSVFTEELVSEEGGMEVVVFRLFVIVVVAQLVDFGTLCRGHERGVEITVVYLSGLYLAGSLDLWGGGVGCG